MATKKVKSKPTTKKVVKKTANKTNSKENISVLRTNVSVVFAMAVEALILLFAYLVIMSV